MANTSSASTPITDGITRLFEGLGFKPFAGAARPRKPTIHDLEKLLERYRTRYHTHNDRYSAQRAQAQDALMAPLTGDFALSTSYYRLMHELEKTIDAAYAKVGRYQRREELTYVNEVSMTLVLAEAVSRLVYMTLMYSEYPADIAIWQHEVALLQSYFGTFTVALASATDENLFGE